VLPGGGGGGAGVGSGKTGGAGGGPKAIVAWTTIPAPTWTSPATASIQEGISADTPITLTPSAAANVDAEDTVVYSNEGAGGDGDFFSVDPDTGAVSTSSGAVFDYEVPGDADTDNVYVFVRRATGTTGHADQTISVTITDTGEGGAAMAILDTNHLDLGLGLNL